MPTEPLQVLGSKKLSPRTWQTLWSQDQAQAVPLPCTGVRMVAGVVGQDPVRLWRATLGPGGCLGTSSRVCVLDMANVFKK